MTTPQKNAGRRGTALTEYLSTHDLICDRCGYNLRGIHEPFCPECRYVIPRPIPETPGRPRQRHPAHFDDLLRHVPWWFVFAGWLIITQRLVRLFAPGVSRWAWGAHDTLGVLLLLAPMGVLLWWAKSRGRGGSAWARRARWMVLVAADTVFLVAGLTLL